MEAAIRWSQDAHSQDQRFLIADVASNRLRHCRVSSIDGKKVEFTVLARKEKVNNFTAFDWHRKREDVVAIGDGLGVIRIVRLEREGESYNDPLHEFRIRHERKCNSLAFNKGSLLACAYDRTRNDASLNIHDLNHNQPNEPIRRLANADSVANVKFFLREPEVLLAGTAQPKQGAFLRLFDLRVSGAVGTSAFVTKHCHLLSIDPLDENYFASAGPIGDPVISIWDRRALRHSNASSLSAMASQSSVLEIRPAIDASSDSKIWSLRYSGFQRGYFGVLSNTGQVRCFETTRYPPNPVPTQNGQTSHNEDWFGGTYFVKRCHELEKPQNNEEQRSTTTSRAIAFDFVSPGVFGSDPYIMTIRNNKSIEVSSVPFSVSKSVLSPTHKLTVFDDEHEVTYLPHSEGAIADDLLAVQGRISARLVYGPEDGKGSLVERSRFEDGVKPVSSIQRHGTRISLGIPDVRPSLRDVLTVQDTQRRRCKEGYMFNCERNKEIVMDDPWLVEMWDIVKRMEDMAFNAGMMHDALDLSYLGVYNIWNGKLGSHPSRVVKTFSRSSKPSSRPEFTNALYYILYHHGYPAFTGVETSFPLQRQLSLAICGWRFSETRLRAKCDDIASRGEYYKAIVVAFCHERKEIAMELLRTAWREGRVSNSGLAVVIAGNSMDSEQRELCKWMAEEATDPYLKALLTYYINGRWNLVVQMQELPLVYRVALALKYLDDDELSAFVESETESAIEHGDIEGIVLAGLAEPAMDLFQTWIAKTSDLQTAVLAMSFTNPRYVDDARWEIWKESYYEQLQSWKCFPERSRFHLIHQKRMSTNPRTGANLIKPDMNQPQLRCNHCQANLARQPNKEFEATDTTLPGTRQSRGLSTAVTAGTVCPKCNRPMPRCALCMLWLGSPDPTKWKKSEMELTEDKVARMAVFCAKCGHGCHAHEARMWWERRSVCPVSECDCVCRTG